MQSFGGVSGPWRAAGSRCGSTCTGTVRTSSSAAAFSESGWLQRGATTLATPGRLPGSSPEVRDAQARVRAASRSRRAASLPRPAARRRGGR
eukprot:6868528-Lingulodinium_polyedra.AAC.1